MYIQSVWGTSLLEIEILEISKSKKAASINMGQLEKIAENEKGKFFLQSGTLDFPKIFLIAEGQLVKSFPKKSYWVLDKIYHPELFNKNINLLLLTKSNALLGRQTELRNKTIIYPSDEYENEMDFKEKNKNEVADKFLLEEFTQESTAELNDIDKNLNEKNYLEDKKYLKLKNLDKSKFSDEFGDYIQTKYWANGKILTVGNLKNKEDKKIFDRMAKGLINKTNGLKFGLSNGLYVNQKKSPIDHEINDQITMDSISSNYNEEQKKNEQISKEALALIKRDGENWSEGMDNETLRRFFIRTGMLEEKERREKVINELDGNEILIYFSNGMSSHTSQSDESYQALGYDFSFSYDLHLSRTAAKLKDISLEFIFDNGVTNYDIGGQNAKSKESRYGIYLNYYFLNNPLTLYNFIGEFGVGIKAGSANIESQNISKSYTYQIFSFPSFKLMTKYRFRTGDLKENTVNVGASINAGLILENKKLTVIDKVEDSINGRIRVEDMKYFLGMSVFF